MLTADEIRSRTFLVALRGYDRDEVKAFLTQVAEQVQDLQERLRQLEQDTPAPADTADVPVEAPAAPVGPVAPAVAEASPFAEIGQQTQRILEAAQAAADDIRKRAREDGDRELKAARAQATRIIAEGERRREEVERVVDALTGARADLSEDLRAVGRTIERALRELAPEPAAATVREALAVTAREERQGSQGNAAASNGAAVPTPAGEDEDDDPRTEPPAALRAVPQPADEAGEQPADAGEPPAAETGEPPAADVGAAPAEELDEAPAEPLAAAPEALSADGDAEALPDEASAERYQAEPGTEPAPAQVRRARALGPLHPRLVRRLKRGLQDLQNATIVALRRDDDREDVEPFLPDAAAVRSLSGLAEEQLSLAHAAGLAAGAQAVGAEIELEPSGTALADQLGSELGGVLVTRLAEALRAGFDAGEAVAALTERVEAVFAKIKNGPAGDVAAVALVRAYEGGQKDAWAAAGVAQRRWVRGVEPPCSDPRCVDNESAGPVPLSERFPSRHDAPPVRPGCSCSTAPVEA